MKCSLLRISSLVVLCFLFYSNHSYGQSQDLDPTNTLNYYQVKESRINFFRVDNRYHILNDTIYYIDRAEFIINLGWDSVKLNDEWYVVLSNPDYKKPKKTYTDLSPAYLGVQIHEPFYLKSKIRHKGTGESIVTKSPSAKPADSTDVSKGEEDTANWVHVPLSGINGLRLCMKKSDFQQLTLIPVYSTSWKRIAFSSGQLTVPFKLRPATQGKNFTMTTDVTLGAYAGPKKRISKRQNYYLTLPVVLGLTFINTSDNTSSTSAPAGNTSSGVYPGWTVATGLIAQFNTFNIGIVTGWDFASQVGNAWIYQGKNWLSFGIGYSFLK